MVFIKKDVNLALLFLLLVPIILFMFASVQYDVKLKSLSMEYEKNKLNFEKISANAVSNCSSIVTPTGIILKDKEAFEQRYYDLSNENSRLKEELNLLKPELETQKSSFDTLYKRFIEVQNYLISANDKISDLTARNAKLCQEIKAAGGQDEKCK